MKYLYAMLVLVICSTQAQTFAPVSPRQRQQFMHKLQSNMSRIKSFACKFDQQKHLQLFADTLQLGGWCYVEKPQNIRWEYSVPLKKMILVRADDLQVYKIKNGQRVASNDLQNNYMKVVYAQIIAFFSGDFSRMTGSKNFTLRVKSNGRGEYLLQLATRGTLSQYLQRIELKIPANCRWIRQVALFEPDGDYTLIALHSFVINPRFREGVFAGEVFDNMQQGLR